MFYITLFRVTCTLIAPRSSLPFMVSFSAVPCSEKQAYTHTHRDTGERIHREGGGSGVDREEDYEIQGVDVEVEGL